MASTDNGHHGAKRLAATGLAALLGAVAAAGPAIEAARQPGGGYRLTLTVQEAIGAGDGQRLLLPTAVRLCDGLPPRFGAYRFETRKAVDGSPAADSFVLVQDVQCGGARPEDKPPTRVVDEPERAAIERIARARAAAYHQALADGRDRDALAMFPGFSPAAPADEAWHREQAAFRAKAGPLRAVDVWNVTVYVDPPGAPEPGVYAATDLEVSYAKLVVCGYFTWFEEPDGVLRITHRDVGEIATDVASKMSGAQLAQVRSDFRCRPDPGPE